MKFLKCYIKLITLGLHLIILSLAIVAICLSFKFDLFTSTDGALHTYEIFTMKDLTFSYQGILNFSNTMIEFSNKNTIFDSFINIKEVLTEVKIMKGLVYTLFASHGLLAIFQLFTYRTKTTFVTCIITTLLLLVLKTLSINVFSDSGLISSATKYYNVVLILWLAATLISGIQISLYGYVKNAKQK